LPWTCDGSPSASLYSGAVQGVDWNPNAELGDLVPRPAALDVAVGNTMAEALSVLVARQADVAADADAALLLNAVQAGIALRDHSGTEAAKLHDALHDSGFSSLSGGSLWVVKAAKPAQDGGPSDTAATLPDALAAR